MIPTTILAQQHAGTFRERFAETPFNVEMVSRLRKQAEIKEVLERFREGKVDILIGTHRLLSRDVRGKDLGLLIVDEEQRFGVRQRSSSASSSSRSTSSRSPRPRFRGRFRCPWRASGTFP